MPNTIQELHALPPSGVACPAPFRRVKCHPPPPSEGLNAPVPFRSCMPPPPFRRVAWPRPLQKSYMSPPLQKSCMSPPPSEEFFHIPYFLLVLCKLKIIQSNFEFVCLNMSFKCIHWSNGVWDPIGRQKRHIMTAHIPKHSRNRSAVCKV